MKAFKIIFLILVLCLLSLAAIGCTEKTFSEPTKTPAITEKDYEIADSIVKGFVTEFYTIDKQDFEIVEEPSKYQTTEEFREAIINETSKFKPFLTEAAFDQFLAARMQSERVKHAYENKYLSEVKDIKWERALSSEYFSRITYKCKIEVIRKSLDEKTSNTVILQVIVNVYNEKEGWRVLPDRSLIVTK